MSLKEGSLSGKPKKRISVLTKVQWSANMETVKHIDKQRIRATGGSGSRIDNQLFSIKKMSHNA